MDTTQRLTAAHKVEEAVRKHFADWPGTKDHGPKVALDWHSPGIHAVVWEEGAPEFTGHELPTEFKGLHVEPYDYYTLVVYVEQCEEMQECGSCVHSDHMAAQGL